MRGTDSNSVKSSSSSSVENVSMDLYHIKTMLSGFALQSLCIITATEFYYQSSHKKHPNHGPPHSPPSSCSCTPPPTHTPPSPNTYLITPLSSPVPLKHSLVLDFNLLSTAQDHLRMTLKHTNMHACTLTHTHTTTFPKHKHA